MHYVDTVMAGHVSLKDLAGLLLRRQFPIRFLLMLGFLIALGSIIIQLIGAKKLQKLFQM